MEETNPILANARRIQEDEERMRSLENGPRRHDPAPQGANHTDRESSRQAICFIVDELEQARERLGRVSENQRELHAALRSLYAVVERAIASGDWTVTPENRPYCEMANALRVIKQSTFD